MIEKSVEDSFPLNASDVATKGYKCMWYGVIIHITHTKTHLNKLKYNPKLLLL